MWSSVAASSVTIGFGGSRQSGRPRSSMRGAAIGSNFAPLYGIVLQEYDCAAGLVVPRPPWLEYSRLPLAGVLFVLEILLFNISMTSMMPLLLSTVSATVVSYTLLWLIHPVRMHPYPRSNSRAFLITLVLDFSGACSIYFIRTTLKLEDRIGKMENVYLKWIMCAVGLGILIFLFPPLYGESYESLGVLLNGKELSLDGQTPLAFLAHSPWSVPIFFMLILLLKRALSMTLTNAGGGVGGTFGPTLLSARSRDSLWREHSICFLTDCDLDSGTELRVGRMAGLMAGVMQSPMTAIFLIAEILRRLRPVPAFDPYLDHRFRNDQNCREIFHLHQTYSPERRTPDPRQRPGRADPSEACPM